jgi:hypothetical protein
MSNPSPNVATRFTSGPSNPARRAAAERKRQREREAREQAKQARALEAAPTSMLLHHRLRNPSTPASALPGLASAFRAMQEAERDIAAQQAESERQAGLLGEALRTIRDLQDELEQLRAAAKAWPGGGEPQHAGEATPVMGPSMRFSEKPISDRIADLLAEAQRLMGELEQQERAEKERKRQAEARAAAKPRELSQRAIDAGFRPPGADSIPDTQRESWQAAQLARSRALNAEQALPYSTMNQYYSRR